MKIKPYKPGATESQVLRQVIEAAQCFGIILKRRNTGAGLNPAGKLIHFGQSGDSDLYGTVTPGPNHGRSIEIEVKREGFKPPRRGKVREHFERQLDRLRQCNESGGIGFWVSDGDDAFRAFRTITTTPGIMVKFFGDFPFFCTPAKDTSLKGGD